MKRVNEEGGGAQGQLFHVRDNGCQSDKSGYEKMSQYVTDQCKSDLKDIC